MKKSVVAILVELSLVGAIAVSAGPARADTPCTKTADPIVHPGLQALLTSVGAAGVADPVACIQSGSYTINASLTIPSAMTVIGVGDTKPVIECASAIYCFDGTAGPSGVALEDLSLHGAQKADIQIGTGAGGLVAGWTLSGIDASGAGQIGIAMNNAQDITVANAAIDGNGSIAFDAASNPTGDFGFRAVRVDGLTLRDSTISNNPTTSSANLGFAGGAKFNTDTNFLVQHNTFTGNYGGAQLWVDIDSQNFSLIDNTIVNGVNDVTGLMPVEGIRVEVSCGGAVGGTTTGTGNHVEGGTTAGVDLYDSNHVTVAQNTITIPQTGSYGIRMFGNPHDVVPGSGCDDAGVYANRDNVASANVISMGGTGTPLNGVVNDTGGISESNTWADNSYTARHCDFPQWRWWDGDAQQLGNFADWHGIGQDAGGAAGCVSLFPEIDGTAPFEPAWGPAGSVVTIRGSGLAGVTSVKFNKIAALFSAADAEIVATVPEGAGTGPVCVKNALASWCSSADFVVTPVVSVSGVLPTSGLPGSDVVIDGAAFTGATGVTFAGVPVVAFTVASDTEIDAVVPPDATSGSVCVILAVQGSVCGASFTVLAPAAPVLAAPAARFQLTRFSAAWIPSDGASSYDVTSSSAPYDGAFPASPKETRTTATSVRMPFVPGDTTCVVVTAQDAAGATPGLRTCTAVPLDDRGLHRSKGSWSGTSAARFFQRTALTSKVRGSMLTLRGVRIRTIALMVEARPGGGSVDVLLNGKLLRTISTAARLTQDRRLVRVASWGSVHRGTISLRVHTVGRGVVIDGLGLSRI